MEERKTKNPKACILLLTLSCNLRCRMCRLWLNEESSIARPSLKQWQGFLDSLRVFASPESNIIFGGGEPLLFPELLTDLISFCKKSGFRTSLATSGYLLDRKMAEDLVGAGLDYIALTLYSLKKETHNLLRGMPDAQERLFQAIEYLSDQKSRLEIAIDTVIMRPNLGELLELAEWARQDDRIRSIFFQSVMQPFHTAPLEEWHNSEEYGFLWPRDINEVNYLLDSLIGMKKGSPCGKRDKINNPVSQLRVFKAYFSNPGSFVKRASCNVANAETFTVSPDGSINLCPYIKPIGNIKDKDINDIWNSQDADDRRREIKLCKKNCHHIINCWYEEEPQK